jgi:hypothetical protein
MAVLPVRTLTDNGVVPTLVPASASDTAAIGNGVNNFAVYTNGSGASVTVTVHGQGTTDYGKPLADNVLTVAAGASLWIPLRDDYKDGTGHAVISLSLATSVTAAVIQVG